MDLKEQLQQAEQDLVKLHNEWADLESSRAPKRKVVSVIGRICKVGNRLDKLRAQLGLAPLPAIIHTPPV